MSNTRLPSGLFEQAWTDYQRCCRKDGLMSLNRFCESREVPVQRLYEWLRRRNISVKEFQSQFSDMGTDEASAGEQQFFPVSVGPHPKEHDDQFCAEGVQIESPGGKLTVRVDRMSLSAFSHLLATIENRR